MSDPNNEGVQGEPISQNDPERAAQYEALRKVNPDLGKSDEQSTNEEPASIDVKQSETKPEPVKQDNGETHSKGSKGFERRIGTLTARTKQLEAELARYKNQAEQKPKDEPKKFTRESFKNDEEYLEYLADVKAEEKVKQHLQNSTKQNEELISERQRQIESQNEWKRKEETVFKGNDQALNEYKSLIEEHEDTVLPQEVWNVINDSDISPFMLAIVLSDEDMRSKLETMSPRRREFFMYDLEKNILANMNKKPQQNQKPPVTNAPTPTGSVSVGGSIKTDSELSQREQLLKRKAELGL